MAQRGNLLQHRGQGGWGVRITAINPLCTFRGQSAVGNRRFVIDDSCVRADGGWPGLRQRPSPGVHLRDATPGKSTTKVTATTRELCAAAAHGSALAPMSPLAPG
jgi:hypothetical protein